MPTKRPRQRIEIDTLFAPSPQALILDSRISHAACRLWDVLYVFRWNGDPPDFDRLAAAMATTERSIYRWLQELESAGWIDWDRNAALQDRFTLRTTPGGQELIVGSNKLTQGSRELIPRSNKLIPGSKELTQVSILDELYRTPVRENDPPQNHQKIQKIQNDDDDARSPSFAHLLMERDMSAAAAAEIAGKGLDQQTVIAFVDAMLAAGKDMGHIVTRLRLAPPAKGQRYESPRRPDLSPDRPKRPPSVALSPERDAEYDQLIAQAEARARGGL